jgi:RNA polymerase sigma factor (sigma-70 family)
MTEPTSLAACGGPAVDWSATLARHQSWLRAVVWARLGEVQAVDEVMQEVALAAVENRTALTDPSKVGSWLYHLAVRQTLLYRRRQGRRRKLVDRYAARCGPREEDCRCPDPLGWLIMLERDALIRDCLKRLPARDVEILLLKYAEGWSYQKLAEHLRISHSAVEARLHRARQRLRQQLCQREVVEGPVG